MTFTKDPSTHPAHGPLTEERLSRVRDWLQSALAYSEGSNRDYMMADAAKAIDELLERRSAPQLPQPAVPDEWRMMCGEWRDETVSIHDASGLIVSGISPNAAGIIIDAHNAYRAAMLQGNHRDLSYPVDPQVAEYEKIMQQAVPDGWVAVPAEPTAEMQSAAAGAIRFDTTPINKLWTGNAVYKAMLAAAPQQEAE